MALRNMITEQSRSIIRVAKTTAINIVKVETLVAIAAVIEMFNNRPAATANCRTATVFQIATVDI